MMNIRFTFNPNGVHVTIPHKQHVVVVVFSFSFPFLLMLNKIHVLHVPKNMLVYRQHFFRFKHVTTNSVIYVHCEFNTAMIAGVLSLFLGMRDEGTWIIVYRSNTISPWDCFSFYPLSEYLDIGV